MTTEPVIVFFKSKQCGHCITLEKIWASPPSKDKDSVITAVQKVYPKIRFDSVTAKDNGGEFDVNVSPKGMEFYRKWFPMIILVPGKLWDAAKSKLGPLNDQKIIDGVQIMNGKWLGDTYEHDYKYDIRDPSKFGEWLKVSLENEDFKRVQSGSIVPIKQPIASQSFQPLLNNIVKPTNTVNNYVATSNNKSDVCSWKVLGRPYK